MDDPLLQDGANTVAGLANSPFKQVHVEIKICVGRARPTVAELLSLDNDSVLSLDSSINDPVDIYAGEKLIARGELEELDGEDAGRLAVRLTEIGVIDEPL
ncbi:MAG: FliM/FliN family flagellar motor switch protein [Mangrovicoccus sp.]|nr:FliM/FliN family flagellar motor switch protein [Mangrovicoccus sp.]